MVRVLRCDGAWCHEVHPPEVGGSRAVPLCHCACAGAGVLATRRRRPSWQAGRSRNDVPLIIRCITARKDACGSQQCGCRG